MGVSAERLAAPGYSFWSASSTARRFAAYVPPGVYTVRAPNRAGSAARVTVAEGRLASASLAVDPRGR